MPDVAFDGSKYLVVWIDQRAGFNNDALWGTQVSLEGKPTSTSGVSYAASVQLPPSLASNGATTLLTYADSGNILGIRIGQDGVALDQTPIDISSATNTQTDPDVASNGTGYLVAWTDYRDDIAGDIYAARISAAGTVSDAAGVAVAALAKGQSSPAVSSNGVDYMVAWTDYRGADADIYGARVGSDGVVADANGIAISTAAGDETKPALSYDGHYWAAAWQDERGDDVDIYGTWLDGATVLDSKGVSISATKGDDLEPALVGENNGRSMVAYRRFDSAPTVTRDRVKMRFIGYLGIEGDDCSQGGDCFTGFCADGVCCDKSCGGSDSTDCQACSKAAGASVDGTCTVLAAGAVCRAGAHDCDADEVCDGNTGDCPADAATEDNTPCDDGNLCTDSDVCTSGSCAGTTKSCEATDACHLAGSCDPASGVCSDPLAENGTTCPDGSCTDGACVPAKPKPKDDEDSGCGCRVVGARQQRGANLAALALLLMAAGLSRRRRRPPPG